MQRWEICVIAKDSGQFHGVLRLPTYKYIAYLLSPQGRKAMDESCEFKQGSYPEDDPTVRNEILREEELIAKLAADGWEPMPVSVGYISGAQGGSIGVAWYFKRPISREAS